MSGHDRQHLIKPETIMDGVFLHKPFTVAEFLEAIEQAEARTAWRVGTAGLNTR